MAKKLSIIVPVLNEEKNILPLLDRIDKTLRGKVIYEVIFIDDRSTDKTASLINQAKGKYPVIYKVKNGSMGKAQSLLEGFSHASYDLVCMLDADLQYPPEMFIEMLEPFDDGYSVVVSRRKESHKNAIRKFASKAFNFVFCSMLHDMPYDVQSGFKIFKKEIIERITLRPLPWSFDLEFLIAARAAGYQIASVDIPFDSRHGGKSKVNIITASLQIGISALILKFRQDQIIPFHKSKVKSIGQGFHYQSREFIHFSNLSSGESAVRTIMGHQVLFIVFALALFTSGLLIQWKTTLIAFVGMISVIYFIDLLFNFSLIFKSLVKSPEIEVSPEEMSRVNEWPRYTIFCPLYHEWRVVKQFVKSIEKLDYPKDKLQVQLLLEEDDTETVQHVRSYNLPEYFQIIVVPDSMPKTKPKACNYGLRFATGEYAVIYDAEDIPDSDQLKKAVVAFQKSSTKTVCIQAKLNYYNRSQNLLTRLFTAEYSLWFDLVLTGLQSMNAPIPLGGTSNHFRVKKLNEVKGWDSFNVTEDCDLGIRLAKRGYTTAIINSDTLEEANSDLMNWINQRSRWIKGYMQTYLVHMRNPQEFWTGNYKRQFIIFQLVVGGKILSLFINPFMWMTTALYFALRAYIGPTIEQFFPGVIFYMAVFSLIFGNFLYMYYYMIGVFKRKQFDLVKFVFFVPLYWLAMSVATWKATFQLIFNPHYWQKTKHGLHMGTSEDISESTTIDTSEQYMQVQVQNDIPTVSEQFSTKKQIKTIFTSGGTLVVASVLANFLNYFYNAFLTRALSLGDFALISVIGNILFLTIIPIESLSATVTYRAGYYFGKYKQGFSSFWYEIRRKSFYISAIVAIAWVLMTPVLAAFFRLESPAPLYAFTPVWIFNTLLAVDLGYLSGTHRFTIIAGIALVAPFIKTLSTIILVNMGYPDLVYISVPLSLTISSLIATMYMRILPFQKTQDEDLVKFPSPYFWHTVLMRFALVAYLSFDVLLAKHILPPHEAGLYALIALVGKTIYFVGGLFNQFIGPYVSAELGEDPDKKVAFTRLVIIAAFTSWIGYIIFGIMGEITAPILLGESIRPVAHLLPIYGAGMFAFTIASSIISYQTINKSYYLAYVSFVLSLIQIILILTLRFSIAGLVEIMTVIGIFNLVVALFAHFFENTFTALFKNAIDFFGLFTRLRIREKVSNNTLNILILNWRDTRHVWSGGAEEYIIGVGSELVKMGHSVTVFCGNDGHAPRYEKMHGVSIIRHGGFYSVYIWAFFYYMLKLRGKFDVIIDSVNGVPFFSPLYAGIPVIGIIHHVHQDVFREHLPRLLALLACYLEGSLMPYVYRATQMVTVSKSTQKAMKTIGFRDRSQIEIISPGLYPEKFGPREKSPFPTLVYLGRLKKYKSLHVIINALPKIIAHVPEVHLYVAGTGEEVMKLRALVHELGVMNNVSFLGRVTDEQKSLLLASSWVFVHPSFIEGWGITALEASASGTPVVASDVPGLRDSVRHGETGYVVEYGNSDEFGAAIITLLQNHTLRHSFEKASLQWASKFSWNKSAERFLEVINKII